MSDQQTPSSSRWRTVKVFISSTFRDMYAERDHLVKVVFPALREKLGKYRVYLIDIDLRWGVTKEQADNDQVLDLCLDLIDDCRPFFIGILGERYGWVPTKILPEAIKRYGWVQKVSGKSLTELEILHGVLNNPEMCGHAFFYLRDPNALSKIPDDIRKEIYVESDPVRIKNLFDLKESIRKSGHPVMDPYPAQWDAEAYDRYTKAKGRLTGLKEFGDSIQKQLWERIKEELKLPENPPMETETDPFAVEQDYHERFIDSRLTVYIGRDKMHKDLLAYRDGDDRRPLIVTGPSGSGKSAILARLSREGAQKDIETCVIPFFIGASPSSTAIRGALHHLCNVIKKEFGLAPEIPAEADKLITTFRSFLFSIPEDKRLVIIIDAINQLDETNHPEELAWLPEELAPNVRIVLSCIDEPGHKKRFIERAREMKIAEKRVDELTNDEREEIIRKVPSVSAKTLDKDQIKMLLDNPATKNPLYLLIALEELRGFGSFDELNKRISEFPRPDIYPVREGEVSNGDQGGDVIQAIFGQVIRRLEEEFDKELVSTILPLLASARRGLSEKELSELIVDLSGKEDLFPVLRQLRTYLMERGEIIDFFHRGLYKAIHSLYLKDNEDRKAYHLRLADYFEKKEIDDRKADELPWQLAQAEEWISLAALLTKKQILSLLWEKKHFEVMAYWSQIETQSSIRLVKTYSKNLNTSDLDMVRIYQRLLNDFGHLDESLYLIDLLMEKARLMQDTGTLANLSNAKGLIMFNQNKLDDALALFNEVEQIPISLDDWGLLSAAKGNKAMIYASQDKWDDAMSLWREQESLSQKTGNIYQFQIAIGNQALAHISRDEFDEALKLLDIKEQICRKTGNVFDLQKAYGNRGSIFLKQGEIDQAQDCFVEQERICRKIGNKLDLYNALFHQARILEEHGDMASALRLCEESLTIARLLNFIPGQISTLSLKATILSHDCERLPDALSLAMNARNLAGINQVGELQFALKSLYSKIAAKLEPNMQADKKVLDMARRGNLSGLKKLVEQGAKVNPEGSQAFSPLYEVASRGDLVMLRYLLAHGAHPDTLVAGCTALLAAIVKGHTEAALELLKAGADPKGPPETDPPLIMAAYHGNAVMVNRLIGSGVNLEAFVTSPYDGKTALMAAAKHKHLDVVEILLRSGARVNTRNPFNGRTALMYAATTGDVNLVQKLLDYKADKAIMCKKGGFPVNYASNEEIGRLLGT